MPIEFHCRQCNKLLRVGDEHAGKNAQCPECQTVQPVPAAEGGGAAAQATGSPFASETDPANPYASPAAAGGYQASPGSSLYGPRTGPPWERDGANFGTLIATVTESMTQPVAFYSRMRREGGLWPPIKFAILVSYLGMLILMVWQLGILAMMMGLAGGRAVEEQLTVTGITFCVLLVIMPLITILHLFISSGIYHLMLMMFGGANQPFEATARTVAYVQGVVNLCLVLPVCGQYISGLVGLVYLIIGLCHVHETSGGKSAAAVLIPFAVCLALIFGFVLLLIASMPRF